MAKARCECHTCAQRRRGHIGPISDLPKITARVMRRRLRHPDDEVDPRIRRVNAAQVAEADSWPAASKKY